MHLPGGSRYVGEFNDNRPHGQGTYYKEDGSEQYKGEFAAGEFTKGRPALLDRSVDEQGMSLVTHYNLGYSYLETWLPKWKDHVTVQYDSTSASFYYRSADGFTPVLMHLRLVGEEEVQAEAALFYEAWGERR